MQPTEKLTPAEMKAYEIMNKCDHLAGVGACLQCIADALAAEYERGVRDAQELLRERAKTYAGMTKDTGWEFYERSGIEFEAAAIALSALLSPSVPATREAK